jgi:hypothetical protein
MRLALQARPQRILERLDIDAPGQIALERVAELVHAKPVNIMDTSQVLMAPRTGEPKK